MLKRTKNANRIVCLQGKNPEMDCSKQACETCEHCGAERRLNDRRARGFSLRWSERREGFDRRRQRFSRKNPYHLVFLRGAHHLRGSEYALLMLLLLFIGLNIADYVFTVRALAAGCLEGNPIMDAMFRISPWAALGLKLALTFIITAMVWTFKRYRVVLEVSILFLIMYMLLIVYHIYGAVVFY